VIQGTNIYLVGLMGAGKTTVGRQLAKRLERRFLDSDQEIEAKTGVRIPVIFEIEGEAGFRRWESQALAELSRETNIVLATGGGVILAPENRRCLRDTGVVVYLHALPEVLHERTRHDRNRPLLQVEDPLARLRQLYRERDSIYREVAHLIIDDRSGAIGQVIQQVESKLKSLCEP
jgi:shikimate kinase